MARKKSTPPDPLRLTAIHEAGHAVLQTVLGIGCGGVTIVPDNAKGTEGHAQDRDQYGKQTEDGAIDVVASLRVWAEDAFLLRHAIAHYAGGEAERRAAPSEWNDRRAGAKSDRREAQDRINEITDDAKSISLLFKYAKRRCAVLVEHYWPEIQAVAAALLESQTLLGEQVERIVEQSVTKRRAAPLGW
jgi:ATP-dependent Zn protease